VRQASARKTSPPEREKAEAVAAVAEIRRWELQARPEAKWLKVEPEFAANESTPLKGTLSFAGKAEKRPHKENYSLARFAESLSGA
jgi:hypothetical protein